MKKAISILCVSMILVGITGCGQSKSIGTSAPEVQVDRGQYLNTNKDVDISNAIAFIETMNQTLEPENQIKDYTTSYDADENTVHVKSNAGTIALKLNQDGEVVMAASCGTPAEKARLSHAIAEVCIGIGLSDSVDQLFSKAEETRWLNNVNAKIAEANLANFNLDELDLSLMDAVAPEIDGMDELQQEISKGLEMPVLTEQLEMAGLQDLSNYFESPSLEDYWIDTDVNKIQQDIANIEKNGISLREYYDKLKLEKQEPILPDTSWMIDMENWSLTMPKFDASFNSGSSTNMSTFNDSKTQEFVGILNQFKSTSQQFISDSSNKMDSSLNSDMESGFDTNLPDMELPELTLPSMSPLPSPSQQIDNTPGISDINNDNNWDGFNDFNSSFSNNNGLSSSFDTSLPDFDIDISTNNGLNQNNSIWGSTNPSNPSSTHSNEQDEKNNGTDTDNVQSEWYGDENEQI